jgi:hypothetical protein
MDPWSPINGVSLERYAELAADVEGIADPAAQAAIVAPKGVSPADWEAAKAGWTARMQDASLMGQVATRFMPLYQAALARKNAASAAAPMNAVSGAMPGAVPPPGYGAAAAPPPGYGAAPAPPPGYGAAPGYPGAAPGYAGAAPGYAGAPAPGHQQQGWPQQQPGYNQQAAAFGNQVGSAFNAFGNALGSFVNGAITPLGPGTPVTVQWSDGQRYPATVMLTQNGQVQVAFPDGRQVWVAQGYVTPR